MTKIDCSKVYIDVSSFSTPENQFDGAFACFTPLNIKNAVFTE